MVLTPSSIHSTWVSRELDEASHEEAEGRKILLPVLAGGMKGADLPPRLRRFKCADFTTCFDDAYRDLRLSVVVHLSRFSGAIV